MIRLIKNKIFLILSLSLFNCIVFSQEIKFRKSKQSFGFVHEGTIVSLLFEFQNTGTQPLVITDYKVECGCTTVEKLSEPILPGEKSALKITFDTNNKYDRQDRTVTVISNATNSPTILRFKGVVLKSKKKK